MKMVVEITLGGLFLIALVAGVAAGVSSVIVYYGYRCVNDYFEVHSFSDDVESDEDDSMYSDESNSDTEENNSGDSDEPINDADEITKGSVIDEDDVAGKDIADNVVADNNDNNDIEAIDSIEDDELPEGFTNDNDKVLIDDSD